MYIFIYFLMIVLVSANKEWNSVFNNASFRKCCEVNETLKKVIDEFFNVNYMCIKSAESEIEDRNIFSNITWLTNGYSITNGFPKSCNRSELMEMEALLSEHEEYCMEQLTVEIFNGSMTSLNSIKSRTIGLMCAGLEKPTNSVQSIQYARKCCPEGKYYDINEHTCKSGHGLENPLRELIGEENYVYEIDYDLFCKPDQFAVELREHFFKLNVDGSSLVSGVKGKKSVLQRGDWCVDREHSSGEILARVCTQNCEDFGALCIHKCCPMDHYYLPRRANTTISTCTARTNEKQTLDLSHYLDPLKKQNKYFQEIIGLQMGLICKKAKGRFMVNKISDSYYMNEAGLLINQINEGGYTKDFCFETFDNRTWGGDVAVEIFSCFEEHKSTKYFKLSFYTLTTSCIFLALTLVVYLSLPELRNLHGRTLICHVCAMLLAYGCLARSVYGLVDMKLCIYNGYSMYFGFVAAFAWLNVMCFDIWWTFGSMRSMQPFQKIKSDRRRFIWYSIYAWSLAIILTTTMLLLDLYPVSEILDANIGKDICWFGSIQNSKNDWPHYIFFVIPIGIITSTNLVLWVLTARYCARVKSEVHRMQAGSVGDRVKKRFRADRAKYLLTVRLWVVMGVGWVWEILSTVAPQPNWLWTSLDVINELQGVFIFIILVMKPKVLFLVKKKLGIEKKQANGTSSGRTSSTFFSRTISTDERNQLRISTTNDKIK